MRRSLLSILVVLAMLVPLAAETRDVGETPRTARYRIASLLVGRTVRSAELVVAINRQVTAGGLASIDATTFGLFSGTEADASCSITSGAAVLTAVNANWEAGDVGKLIDVAGAGTAGGTLRSRIKTYTSPTSITLWDNAITTVAASRTSVGGLAAWGGEINATTTTPKGANEAGTSELAATSLQVTATGSTTARSLSARAADVFIVKDFGASGDGVADDTAEIQLAIDAACVAGGTVVFPVPGRYRVTGQLLVSSKYAVHLVSEMFGYGAIGLSPVASCILVGGNITGSIIKFSSPVANRANAGGGLVRGLSFRDDTGGTSTPGTYTMTAALDLRDFNLSRVESCSFEHLNGSAIRTDFCVMTEIVGCVIRYCGAASKPALWITQTDAVSTSQSLTVSGSRLEVNHSAPYIQVDDGPTDVKIIGCGFEADTAVAASCQKFLSLASDYGLVATCHFNRNTAVQAALETTGSFWRISGSGFRGSANATAAATLAGIDSAISDCFFNSGKTADEITISGVRNTVSACEIKGSGGITCTASTATIIGCHLGDLVTTNAYWIVLASDCSAVGNTVQAASVAGSSGGIKVAGTLPRCTGNLVKNMAGVGIYCDTPNGVVVGNACYQNGTDFSGANLPAGVMANIFSGADYLQGASTWDPPSVAAGATAQTTVNVTDARVGDFAEVSHASASAAVVFLGTVISNNNVTVTLWNRSAGAVDLASGTLRVKVRKAL